MKASRVAIVFFAATPGCNVISASKLRNAEIDSRRLQSTAPCNKFLEGIQEPLQQILEQLKSLPGGDNKFDQFEGLLEAAINSAANEQTNSTNGLMNGQIQQAVDCLLASICGKDTTFEAALPIIIPAAASFIQAFQECMPDSSSGGEVDTDCFKNTFSKEMNQISMFLPMILDMQAGDKDNKGRVDDFMKCLSDPDI